jgi:putative membrane protein insertion efficiency factor
MFQILKFGKDIPKNIGKFLIKIYQKLFSFDHAFWAKWVGMRVCIFEPSCSEYTYHAIDRFGLIRGGIMGFFRILRCNPFSKPGEDSVPNEFSIHRNTNNETLV